MVKVHSAAPAYNEAAQLIVKDFLASKCAVFSVAYVIGVAVLSRMGLDSHYLAHKAGWKRVMYAYNMVMSVYSLVTFLVMAEALSTYGYGSDDCTVHLNVERIQTANYLFYLSKFVEYADTFFLIIRGAPITWLQYIHHIGAAVNMWSLTIYGGEPVWIFTTWNSFIHAIMYCYFAYSVYGITILPKPVITSLQLTQFFTGLGMLTYTYLTVPCFVKDPVQMLATFYLSWVYVGAVAILFLNFFLQNYVKKPKKKEAKKVEKKVD